MEGAAVPGPRGRHAEVTPHGEFIRPVCNLLGGVNGGGSYLILQVGAKVISRVASFPSPIVMAWEKKGDT